MQETVAVIGGGAAGFFSAISCSEANPGLRVVVFEVENNARYPEAPPVPRTVLINPEIDFAGDESVDGWEGCLSVPGLRGVVPRHRRIRYRGFDADGRRFEREAKDFHARVVQH